MASTVSNNKEDDEYREIIDTPQVRAKKIAQLAALVKKHSGKVVVFTGAGISTGAGIPDFRSGLGSATGLPPGKWCQDATAKQWTEAERKEIERRKRKTTSCLQAIPTKSHMALVALERAGVLRGLISQNCDGLHRRSGFNPDALAELHGNTNLEYCGWCGHEYLRDFRASTGRRTKGAVMTQTLWPKHKKLKHLINPRRGRHYTGRRCAVDGCDGYLFDSTIDFGDNLPEKHINRGYKLAEEAELCIVLGSRCSVSPACDMPISVGESGRKLVIVNLQRTGADSVSSLRIGAKIDDVMVPLMEALGIRIPSFQLRRVVQVERHDEAAEKVIRVCSKDDDGVPVDLLWNVQAHFDLEKPPRYAEGSAKPNTSTTAVKGFVSLNQDAVSARSNRRRAVAVGDRGVIVQWPWENMERPGYADVTFVTGNSKGKCLSVPAGQCDMLDLGHMTPDGRGAYVVDAASKQGAELTHVIHLTPQLQGHLKSLHLMFRAHYGEIPVKIPIPERPGAAGRLRIELRYDPLSRVWASKLLAAPGSVDSDDDDDDDDQLCDASAGSK